jgi:hypothetical protein
VAGAEQIPATEIKNSDTPWPVKSEAGHIDRGGAGLSERRLDGDVRGHGFTYLEV